MPPETLSKFDKRIKRKIIAAADSIKRKYASLKLERNEEDDAITKFFNPIKEPLIKVKNEEEEDEEKEEEEDQEGIDFKPKKIRKISKYASTSRPKEEVFEVNEDSDEYDNLQQNVLKPIEVQVTITY
ncbi:unnamed protein product [Ceutorhynchus assimilis]|uniref:Uncharacterized protein n=1 Tax=Ceutorhynchus assimilis TaxID=467358 RepID=A0A9N9MXJ8_9CUCU|nr:unnamed protein product [Ceutorhynchus assimilis]